MKPLSISSTSTISSTGGMSTGEFNRLADVSGAQAMLLDLCGPFAHHGFSPECVVVHPDAIPHPEDHLLVHHDHMTIVLEEHHGAPVNVHVLEEHLSGDSYTRMISLTPGDSDKVVEWGIVRLNLKYVSDEVRQEILS